MRWEEPTFTEIKMDSEVTSYQEESGDLPAADADAAELPAA